MKLMHQSLGKIYLRNMNKIVTASKTSRRDERKFFLDV